MADALVTLQAPLSMRFSSKNPGEGCHVLLQGSSPQGLKLSLLRWQAGSWPLHTRKATRGGWCSLFRPSGHMLVNSPESPPGDTPRTTLHSPPGKPLSQSSFINCYLFPSLPQRHPGFCSFVCFYQDSSSSGEGNNQTFCGLLALTLDWYWFQKTPDITADLWSDQWDFSSGSSHRRSRGSPNLLCTCLPRCRKHNQNRQT